MQTGEVGQTQHAPPPTGRGVYWAINEDWRRHALFGLGFVALTVAVFTPHFMRLTKAQNQSFAAVSAYLAAHDLREPPGQKTSRLSRHNDRFHWRGIVWKNAGDRWVPYIFSIQVDTSDHNRITDAQLMPYERRTAYGLEIYDRVHEHPVD
ncbi:MAG: hypothetical protein ABII82_18210 [Verrucomicrobiota bacterium]